MLNRLKYSVTFPSTGRTLAADLVFERGMTAIVGPNESGKTMVLEVARWLLFGTNVLRGKADHYKTLVASGEFVIKGNIVEIERNAKGATMKRNGTVVATGTKPVNMKVVEELGFGQQVFDIANCINQGEVEKLGSMTPGARKAMVDSVLGLNMLDLVAKWAADEAKLLERQAEGVRERMTPPGVMPEQPKGYLPSDSARDRLQVATQNADELAQIEGWLSHDRARPEKPTTKVDLPAANLESLAGKRRAARETVESLTARIKALPEKATFTPELLDQVEQAWTAFHAYDAEARWAAQNPLPGTSPHDLLQMEIAWSHRDDWARYEQQLVEVERLRAALEAVDKIDCPECQHSFALHADHAARLAQELADAQELVDKPVVDKPDEPRLRSAEVTRLQLVWEQADEPRHAAFKAMTPVEKPDLAEHLIPTFRGQFEQVQTRRELQAQAEAAEKLFGDMPDYEAMLADRRAYETALAVWQAAETDYQKWLVEREAKTLRKTKLVGAPEARDRIAEEYRQAVDYETQVGRWTVLQEQFTAANTVVNELDFQAAEHRKIREVLSVLRGKIKQHVLPSLNKVSSQLLRQMTGGQRNLIAVDDDFDVMVDGQELDTLSGSGKAVANLSLRIALGQVLTNRVMSIMLADEVDGSMDDFRAEKTSDVLRMLEERVSQVLVVSHKQIEAPHYVRLGGSLDDHFDLGAAEAL